MHTYIALFGLALYFVGGIWLFFIAARENPLWILASLIFPFGLLFVASHWEDTKKPFFVQLFGVLFLVFGGWLGEQG